MRRRLIRRSRRRAAGCSTAGAEGRRDRLRHAKTATPPPLSDVELTGKKLFVQRCALCHDLLGQPATTTVGPWIDGEVVKARGEDAVRQKILNGSPRMPGWRYTLKPQQIDSVIAYLKTVTPDQRPKPGRSGDRADRVTAVIVGSAFRRIAQLIGMKLNGSHEERHDQAKSGSAGGDRPGFGGVAMFGTVADDPPGAPMLSGTVRSATGKPLGGVAVSARPDGKSFTRSVYTDESGEFYFPPFETPFEPGKYQVWAQAVGFERASVE